LREPFGIKDKKKQQPFTGDFKLIEIKAFFWGTIYFVHAKNDVML
jgi:hypothetical protein